MPGPETTVASVPSDDAIFGEELCQAARLAQGWLQPHWHVRISGRCSEAIMSTFYTGSRLVRSLNLH